LKNRLDYFSLYGGQVYFPDIGKPFLRYEAIGRRLMTTILAIFLIALLISIVLTRSLTTHRALQTKTQDPGFALPQE